MEHHVNCSEVASFLEPVRRIQPDPPYFKAKCKVRNNYCPPVDTCNGEEVWLCGCVGVWVCGVWLCGCVGVWVCGVWLCGCVAVWLCGV